jgi:hypothetical protein
MTSVSYIMLMARALHVKAHEVGPPARLLGATEDLRAAYRQMPLLSEQVKLCITLVWNFYSKQIDYHEIWGQPFGAGHAVPNFYRLATWAMRVSRRLLHLVADHFFDDYFFIETEHTLASGVWAFKRIMAAIGLELDPKKSQPPAEVWTALGVVFDMQAVRSHAQLSVKPKLSRILNTMVELVEILKHNRLTPSHAAKVFGRLDFINTTLFGRVGRTGLNPIKKRQGEVRGPGDPFSWKLDPMLRGALVWLIEVLLRAPPRELPLEEPLGDLCLLYTDGSSEEKRTPPHGIGCVLVDLKANTMEYTMAAVPQEVVEAWLPRKNYIGLVELFAGPVALDTWSTKLANRHIIHFVDNNGALGALVKGYSKVEDCIKLASDYWLRAASHRVFTYVDRVESKSNLSDGPSRFYVEHLEALGATFVEPNLTYLSSPAPPRDPSEWFGTPERWTQDIQKLHHTIFPAATRPP